MFRPFLCYSLKDIVAELYCLHYVQSQSHDEVPISSSYKKVSDDLGTQDYEQFHISFAELTHLLNTGTLIACMTRQ